MLLEMAAALDAMPSKELIADVLVNPDSGKCCALGAVLLARGVVRPWRFQDDRGSVAEILDIDERLLNMIEDMNDENPGPETTAERWTRMRAWVAQQRKETTDDE